MKKYILQILLFTCLAVFCCSCNRNGNSNMEIPARENLSDISSRIDTANGTADIFLRIASDTKTDSTHIYVARGLYKTDTVGLQIEVCSKQNAGITSNGKDFQSDGFAAGGVKFKSIGKQSDKFVQAMGLIYGFPTSKDFSNHAIAATDFSMNEEEPNLDKKENYQFKLFLAEEDTILSSELYMNINLKKDEIEILEKDEGYRENLIKIWTE